MIKVAIVFKTNMQGLVVNSVIHSNKLMFAEDVNQWFKDRYNSIVFSNETKEHYMAPYIQIDHILNRYKIASGHIDPARKECSFFFHADNDYEDFKKFLIIRKLKS